MYNWRSFQKLTKKEFDSFYVCKILSYKIEKYNLCFIWKSTSNKFKMTDEKNFSLFQDIWHQLSQMKNQLLLVFLGIGMMRASTGCQQALKSHLYFFEFGLLWLAQCFRPWVSQLSHCQLFFLQLPCPTIDKSLFESENMALKQTGTSILFAHVYFQWEIWLWEGQHTRAVNITTIPGHPGKLWNVKASNQGKSGCTSGVPNQRPADELSIKKWKEKLQSKLYYLYLGHFYILQSIRWIISRMC